jgi:hypothetical protein
MIARKGVIVIAIDLVILLLSVPYSTVRPLDNVVPRLCTWWTRSVVAFGERAASWVTKGNNQMVVPHLSKGYEPRAIRRKQRYRRFKASFSLGSTYE